jgi:hypothetical protein
MASIDDLDDIESLLFSTTGSQDPTQFGLTKPYLIFKVYPDGKEEMVRGVEFGSLNITTLKRVLATSDVIIQSRFIRSLMRRWPCKNSDRKAVYSNYSLLRSFI